VCKRNRIDPSAAVDSGCRFLASSLGPASQLSRPTPPVLSQQEISVAADRAQLDAVLKARDKLGRRSQRLRVELQIVPLSACDRAFGVPLNVGGREMVGQRRRVVQLNEGGAS